LRFKEIEHQTQQFFNLLLVRRMSRRGETAEVEGREAIINTPLHLMRHPNGVRGKEQFSLEERRKRVKTYDTTRP